MLVRIGMCAFLRSIFFKALVHSESFVLLRNRCEWKNLKIFMHTPYLHPEIYHLMEFSKVMLHSMVLFIHLSLPWGKQNKKNKKKSVSHSYIPTITILQSFFLLRIFWDVVYPPPPPRTHTGLFLFRYRRNFFLHINQKRAFKVLL